jgi:hypothetical protein
MTPPKQPSVRAEELSKFWFKCSDVLPDKGKDVLTASKNHVNWFTCYWSGVRFERTPLMPVKRVTYWMPLPSKPSPDHI